MFGRGWLVAVTVVGTLGVAACQPVLVTVPGGGSGIPCYAGTSSLSTEQVLGPLSSTLGPINVAPQPGGLTLTTTATTWSLVASQTFGVSFTDSSGVIAGTAAVTASANGTLSTSGTATLSFTTTGVHATANFTGTRNGSPLQQNGISLEALAVDQLFALSGPATFTCAPSGSGLAGLDFGSFNMSFGPAPCYVGTFDVAGQQLPGPVNSSLYGPITLTGHPGGSIRLVTTPTAWSLSAHETFDVSFAAGSGTSVVDATARGTYTAGPSSLTFATASAGGTASFDGTYNGNPVNITGVSLASLGIATLYQLAGSANYTCSTDGTGTSHLSSLQFTSFGLTF
jgi:hypothetical protein